MKINSIGSNYNLSMKGQFKSGDELNRILKWADKQELNRFKDNLERMKKVDDGKVYSIDIFDDWHTPDDENYTFSDIDLKFYTQERNEQNKSGDYIELKRANSKLALINNQLEKLYPKNNKTKEKLQSEIMDLLI